MTTGQALKDAGQSDVLAADASIIRDYASLVVEAVEWWGADGSTFTAEDVRLYIGLTYPDAQPHSPNVLPATIGGLAAAGRITAVGHVQCTRTSRRAGWMRLWRLTPQAPSRDPLRGEVEDRGGERPTPAAPSPVSP